MVLYLLWCVDALLPFALALFFGDIELRFFSMILALVLPFAEVSLITSKLLTHASLVVNYCLKYFACYF